MTGNPDNLIGDTYESIQQGIQMTDTPIPGTYLFDGRMACKGYALNKMCYSFNNAKNRQEFRADEIAYCDRFGLSEEHKLAIKNRNVLALLAAGGNVYYLAKFAGIFGLNMQDIGAQQTGMSVQEFKARLASYTAFNAAVTAGEPSHV